MLLTSAHTAHADIISYTGTHTIGDIHNQIDMGHTHIGQSGTLNNWFFTLPSGQSTGQQTGYIPAMSSITFTFTYNASTTSIYGYMDGAYNFSDGPNNYSGWAYADTVIIDGNIGTINGISTPGTALVLATANLTGTTITSTFINNSSVDAIFNLFQVAFLNGGTAKGSYNVASLSAVPLPAALPMFASLLMGMFGFSRFKNRKTQTA